MEKKGLKIPYLFNLTSLIGTKIFDSLLLVLVLLQVVIFINLWL